MDETTPPSWGLDEEVQGAVLIESARRLMLEGDYEGAVGVAEELLDADPADVDALLLVADAAPRYGHGEVGVLASRQARRLGAETAVLEAAALLAACEVEPALAVADERLGVAPGDARAHAVRGQALEVLGRLAESDEALARAHALRPDAYPAPLGVADTAWPGLLRQARAGLCDDVEARTDGWEFSFLPAPTPERLRSSSPPIPPGVHALTYDGGAVPLCELYTRALTRGCGDTEELVLRLVAAIEGEVAHLDG